MTKHHLARWIAVLAWLGLIYVLSDRSGATGPPTAEVVPLDVLRSKAAHVAVYGVLSMLLMSALGQETRRVVTATLVVVLLYAIGDEAHQARIPGRTASGIDVLIDLLGAAAGVWLLGRLTARARNRVTNADPTGVA